MNKNSIYTKGANDMSENVNQENPKDVPRLSNIGRVDINTIPLPDKVYASNATYTYSGKILVSYRTEEDPETADFYNLAILDDDGSNFKVIFSGVIKTLPTANGIRYMPFQDNTRLLLGDYILECEPNIDDCTSTLLVPVIYPAEISKDPRTTHHWSEIIIAPDNKHISWTLLRSDVGGAVALGTLIRKTGVYEIADTQLISTLSKFSDDPDNPGYLIPNPVYGGEVKQFIHGGNAISAVGGGKFSTPDSVVQDLRTETLKPITNTPGYNETTILSPDERLGIVMSTRFSEHTDPAVIGLLPRPFPQHTSMGISWALYTYAIAGVRNFRPGNIGPVLIDIHQSMNTEGYLGIQLTTEEDWVYVSPISWHPDNRRAMWLEMKRGSQGLQMRLQKVNLLDYEPQPPVAFEATTDDIPYGVKDLSTLNSVNPAIKGKIRGEHSGVLHYSQASSGHSENTLAEYINFSNDGIHYYNGYEKSTSDFHGENCYESNLQLTGPESGEMNLRVTFSAVAGPSPLKLLFEPGADGKAKSYGYASYGGITLEVVDLLE